MKGSYVVAAYQGRISVRFVPHTSTTVYMDKELGAFDTEDEAKAYAASMEDEIWSEYEADHTCPDCGYLNTNNDGWCYCLADNED